MLVTARAGDVFTIVRGQDGSTALMFGAGDIAAQRIVAAELRDYASKTYGGTFSSAVSGITPAANDSSAQFATTAWVTGKGYGPALGYTPANIAGDVFKGSVEIDPVAGDSLIVTNVTNGSGVTVKGIAGTDAGKSGLLKTISRRSFLLSAVTGPETLACIPTDKTLQPVLWMGVLSRPILYTGVAVVLVWDKFLCWPVSNPLAVQMVTLRLSSNGRKSTSRRCMASHCWNQSPSRGCLASR